MTSWLRGTDDDDTVVHSSGRLDSLALLVFSDFPPPAPVGGACRACGRLVDAIEAPHLDFLGRRLGRDVVVQHLGFRLLHVLVDDDADDDVLVAAEGPLDAKAVAFADGAVGFGGLVVDVDLSALAGALGFRSRLEEARDVEPDVETNRVAQMKISTLPLAFSVSTNACVCSWRFWPSRYCSSCGRTSSSGTVRDADFSATLMM